MAKKAAENELQLFVKENNYSNYPQLKEFEGFLTQAKEWESLAKDLVVTSVTELDKIANAKKARIAVKNIRTAIETRRKLLKEFSLNEGRAIDGVAKFLTAYILPTEAHLEEQEKFVEREQAKLDKAIIEERENLLLQYEVETQFFDLLNMPQENFDVLLSNSKLAYEARLVKKEEEEKQKAFQEEVDLRKTKLSKIGLTLDDHGNYSHRLGVTVLADLVTDLQTHDFNKIFEVTEKDLANLINEEAIKIAKLENKIAENKAKQEAEEKLRSKRNAELRPYIIFIRDYNKMLGLDEADYQKELLDIKSAAQQHYEFEAKETARKNQEQADLEAKIETQRKEKLLIEKELQDKNDAEIKAEQDRLAAIEANLLKGDKEKFLTFINELDELKLKYRVDNFKSKKHQKLSLNVNDLLNKVTTFITEKI